MVTGQDEEFKLDDYPGPDPELAKHKKPRKEKPMTREQKKFKETEFQEVFDKRQHAQGPSTAITILNSQIHELQKELHDQKKLVEHLKAYLETARKEAPEKEILSGKETATSNETDQFEEMECPTLDEDDEQTEAEKV